MFPAIVDKVFRLRLFSGLSQQEILGQNSAIVLSHFIWFPPISGPPDHPWHCRWCPQTIRGTVDGLGTHMWHYTWSPQDHV